MSLPLAINLILIRINHIIFLDIKMDKIDGIETAKRIREVEENTYIVFVTAFIEYSLEGYNIPVGITSFELSKFMPENFKSSLPSIDEIENEFKDK